MNMTITDVHTFSFSIFFENDFEQLSGFKTLLTSSLYLYWHMLQQIRKLSKVSSNSIPLISTFRRHYYRMLCSKFVLRYVNKHLTVSFKKSELLFMSTNRISLLLYLFLIIRFHSAKQLFVHATLKHAVRGRVGARTGLLL